MTAEGPGNFWPAADLCPSCPHQYGIPERIRFLTNQSCVQDSTHRVHNSEIPESRHSKPAGPIHEINLIP